MGFVGFQLESNAHDRITIANGLVDSLRLVVWNIFLVTLQWHGSILLPWFVWSGLPRPKSSRRRQGVINSLGNFLVV
jgi:hypothetical protein